MANKVTFSVKEAAELLSLNPETIRRAYRDGRLKGAMLGGQGKLLFSRTEMERFWRTHGGGELFPKAQRSTKTLLRKPKAKER